MPFDLASLSIPLVCPACRAPLVQDADRLLCTSEVCRQSFPIRDGIPALVVGESDTMDEAEWTSIVDSHEEIAP